ncbi:metallophosphoesterase family protein [Solicola gregarius]|uniref:Nuclease SbcCD subunit D n=1 Tax=Solicola gregarius TaxID=2908642 RepID=A0AA46TGJ6_9ACTN|nr:metallophosphoesterase [Solicola gregarius]UYM04745.1 metallophosphoesterase [Solicola gregarius]
MRFIASADWQLGMAAAFLDDEARPRYTQARFDAITRIADLAEQRDAAFVVVAGDVFESNHLDRAVIARAFEALRRVPVPVYLLPGNHDPLDASSIYRSRQFRNGCPSHVHVLESTAPVTVDGSDAELIGVPWFTKRPLTDLVADALSGLEPTDATRVLVGHGRTEALNRDRHDPTAVDEDALRSAVDDGRITFAVLGDRHATYAVSDAIWYPGTPEVTARREADPGNVLVVDLDGSGPTTEKVSVGEWTFTEHAAEVTHDADIEALEAALDDRSGKHRTAIWLRLSGTLSVAQRARLDDVVERAADVYAGVALVGEPGELVVVPDDHDFSDLALVGASQSAVDDLVREARSQGRDARVAQDALGLLYRLTRSGR